MKNKTLKIISALLALCLVVALSAAFAGCDGNRKRRQRDAVERAESVENVENSFLSAVNENWGYKLSDAHIALLEKPGDYVVASGWTDLFGEALKNSELQTAKLKNLASAMDSQEGKALLESFGENAQSLLPVLRSVGFTKYDISSLFYDLAYSLINDSGKTLDGIMSELGRVRKISGLTSNALQNVVSCVADVNSAKSSLVPSVSERERMTEAFENARGAIEATIGFAYDMFFGTLTDDLWQDLFEGSGALENITDGEINLVVSSLLSNVDSLKTALTKQQIDATNLAFDLLINNFEEDALSSDLYAQIVRYAKYVNMFIGAAPMLLEAINSVGAALGTPEMIAELRDNASHWNPDDGTAFNNTSVIAANIIKNFMEAFDATSLKAQFETLLDMSGANNPAGVLDIDKMSLLLGIDSILNVVNMSFEEEDMNIRHPDILSQDELADMMSSAIGTRAGLNRLKQTYRAVKRKEERIDRFIVAVNACRFGELGVLYNNNEQITEDNIDAVYDFYMSEGVSAVKKKMAGLCQKAKLDLDKYIDEYYEQDSPFRSALLSVAAMPLTSTGLDEAAMDALVQALKTAGLEGIVQMFSSYIR